MKTLIFYFLILFSSSLISCENNKNYSVSISGATINVRMHAPTIGLVGINQVGYDGFSYEDVDKEIFEKIRSKSYNGNYNVYVTLEFLDNKGNRYDGDKILVTTLNGSEVKKYANYYYFKGRSKIEKAYPWNHQY